MVATPWIDCDGKLLVDADGKVRECEEDPCPPGEILECVDDGVISYRVPTAAPGFWEVTIDFFTGVCAAYNGTYLVPVTFGDWFSGGIETFDPRGSAFLELKIEVSTVSPGDTCGRGIVVYACSVSAGQAIYRFADLSVSGSRDLIAGDSLPYVSQTAGSCCFGMPAPTSESIFYRAHP